MKPTPRAILFDTGGTVLDWHGSLAGEVRDLRAEQFRDVDPGEFVNEWRRRTMRVIVGQVRPAFDMDDVHLRALDETVAHFGMSPLEGSTRQRLWQGWHRLRAWPDFPQHCRDCVSGSLSYRSRCCLCPLCWTCRGSMA